MCMPIKLKNHSESLVSKEFPGKNGGYDSFSVDALLDSVIKDYELVEKNILISKDERIVHTENQVVGILVFYSLIGFKIKNISK